MTPREPDRFNVDALMRLGLSKDAAIGLNRDIAAALRAEAADALERAAQAFPDGGGYTWIRNKLRALASPAAAPAAERIRTVPMMPVDEEADARMDALRAAQPSEPAVPAHDWSVRAGDKCTRVGCDRKVVAACLPHSFGGCDEHMREHDARCSFALIDGAAPHAKGEGKT